MNNFCKSLFLFTYGFMLYITIETIYRGYSFVLMGVCGGLTLYLLDKINNKISWDTDILLQGIIGSILITSFEFVLGELSLIGVVPKMWDYNNVPLNYKGIISLPFSLLWILFSIGAVLLADAINYYILGDNDIPYYRLFGKVILRFKSK